IFDLDWWIARLVISTSNQNHSELGFVPSPRKLQQWRVDVPREGARRRRAWSLLRKKTISNAENHQATESEETPPYEVVPCIRPICLVGPSLKGFQVTDMLHKAVVDVLTNHFKDRIMVVPLNTPSLSPTFDMTKLPSSEVEKIFEISTEMKLILLESENINHPKQFARSTLAPIFIYLKISDIKVFQHLTKFQGVNRKDAKRQLIFAVNLAKCPNDSFDLIVEENTLATATDQILKFLENYWDATHLF
uniref:Guanylate kinase/L-type calcium channel beta subunit domain-containing protein n=1 Tax=Acrobeloides nanus TaxID=290746 RepID=A0A914C9R4_9BILA